MAVDGICKFCQKSVDIPDNLRGTVMRCPFCLRDFDAFEPQKPSERQISISPGQKQGVQNLTSSADEFLQIRAAKKLATDFGCGLALLLAAVLAFFVFPASWPYFLLAGLAAGILFCGAWIMLTNRYFARSINNAFNSLFAEACIEAPANRELYMKLLADFSSRLKISEEKVISDPFLREILNRLADDLEKPQRQ